MKIHQVLIADDDSALIRMLRITLEPMGVQIRETYDATSALTMIHRSPPALVILDINMPGGNGMGACEMLKTDRTTEKMPVIILTGRNDEATKSRCAGLGAHLIQKGPNALAEVKNLVSTLLEIPQPVAAA